jgi:hypothetical protein
MKESEHVSSNTEIFFEPQHVNLYSIAEYEGYAGWDGSTLILDGDKLYVMADDQKSMEKLYICLGKHSA